MNYEETTQFRKQTGFMYHVYRTLRDQLPKHFEEQQIYTVVIPGKTLLAMFQTCRKSYQLLGGKNKG